jgi:hypothetical protein
LVDQFIRVINELLRLRHTEYAYYFVATSAMLFAGRGEYLSTIL